MSDKERLEEIESLIEWIELKPSQIDTISQVLDYAKEQAERLHELEETIERYQSGRIVAISTKRKLDELEAENNRYREALEFYAQGKFYKDDVFSYGVILIDSGEKAREVLEGGE